MPGLRNDDYPLVRLAPGFAQWMMGAGGGSNSLIVYTACAADIDGGSYPTEELNQLNADPGTYPQTPMDKSKCAVISQQDDGEITLYSFNSFHEPNMTVDGGWY